MIQPIVGGVNGVFLSTKDTITDFLLILICGMVIGSFLTILRGAFIFLKIKKDSRLEDGEVLVMKTGNRFEAWANAETLLGAFHALFLLVFNFLPTPRHFLHRKSTMTIVSILAATLCALYATSTYAMYHKHTQHLIKKKIEKTVPHVSKKPELETRDNVEKRVHEGVKHDEMVSVKPNITNTNNPVKITKEINTTEKQNHKHDIIIKEKPQKEDKGDKEERPQIITEKPQVPKVTPNIKVEVPEEKEPKNLVQNVGHRLFEGVNKLFKVLSNED